MIDNELPFWRLLPDRELLAALIKGEAESEPDIGKCAIVHVVLNRARYGDSALVPWFPSSVVEVILMPQQFSCFWHDYPIRKDAMKDAMSEKLYLNCVDLAISTPDPTLGADHYFRYDIPIAWQRRRRGWPVWAAHFSRTIRIGHHDFYRSFM